MGATNHTTNYNLSQFVGTDKPAWLQDYNGDMSKIDVGINAAKVAADSAGLAAGNAQNDADTANTAITNTITPAITLLQTTVGNQGGAINTINSLIGNGTPTTTDQTIIGAINEINGELGAYQYEGQISIEANPDGVKTIAELEKELYDGFYNYIQGLTSDKYYKFDRLMINSNVLLVPEQRLFDVNTVPGGTYGETSQTSSTGVNIKVGTINGTLSSCQLRDVKIEGSPATVTITDQEGNIGTGIYNFKFSVYTKIK